MISKSFLRLSGAAFVLAMAAGASPARAQNFDSITSGLTDTLQTAIDLLPEDVTNVRLGLGPVIAPSYEGSDEYNIDPVPVVSLRYKNFLEVDNNEIKLTALNRLFSAGSRMRDGSSLRLGPLVSINFGRDEDASADLTGMGNVGTSLELGGFISFAFSPTSRIRLRARHDVVGGHGGATAVADFSQTFIRSTNFALGGRVGGTWASGPYMRSFFGVSPAQAARSGYPVFRPSAGFKDVNFALDGNYRIATQWSLVANVSYKRLLGQAADSPIVRLAGSPNQMLYSTYLVYSF
jgi:outer membrane protein